MPEPVNTVSGARPIAALAIASALVIGASVEYFGLIEKLTAQAGDAYRIGAQVVRFQQVAERTRGESTLGYFNDREKGSRGDQAAVAAAQYALAPQLLATDESRQDVEYWVGDFTAPREFARIGEVKDLRMVADLGNGVVLYRRGAEK